MKFDENDQSLFARLDAFMPSEEEKLGMMSTLLGVSAH